MSVQKTMTPKHAPPCRKCKGIKTIKAIADGVEVEKPCPAYGGTGKGKLATKWRCVVLRTTISSL
jgi:hypothetical protein